MKAKKPASVKETLQRALALLKGGKAWTKCQEARNASGRVVDPDDPRAVKFCMIGALSRVDGRFEDAARSKLHRAVSAYSDQYSRVINFNDARNTTFADVRKVFQLAITDGGKKAAARR